MATNEILLFAGTDTGTNLLTQSEYVADSQRTIGNQSGVARSKLVNKVLRQTSYISAALAKYISDTAGVDVLDDGSITTLVANINSLLVNTANVQTIAGQKTFAVSPIAPTPPSSDNSQAVATTAFVKLYAGQAPTVQTDAATSIGGSSFVANGQITSFTGFDNSTTQVRFSYGTDTAATNIGVTTWVNKADLTAFSATVSSGINPTTTYYFKAQIQDTNRPNQGIYSGSVLSLFTGSETAGTIVNITGATTGGGVTAYDPTSVNAVVNGSIASNVFTASADSASATTYEFNQANTTKIAPTVDITMLPLTIDGTSTASVPVFTSGTDNLLLTGGSLVVDDGGTIKQVVMGTVTKTGTYATFDPATKGTAVTLSGGNLSYSNSGSGTAQMIAYSTTAKTGKRYFEVTVTAKSGTGDAYIGISTVNSYQLNFLGAASFNYGKLDNGPVYNNNAAMTLISGGAFTYTTGDIIGVAIDTVAGTLSFTKNGGVADVVAIPTGTAFYGGVNGTTSGEGFTINFGASAFSYLPSGYSSWADFTYSIAGTTPSLTNNPSWAAKGGQTLRLGTSATSGAESFVTVSATPTLSRLTNKITFAYPEQGVTANYFRIRSQNMNLGDAHSRFYAETKHS